MTAQQLETRYAALKEQYENFRSQQLSLDLTRGKPATAQLDLSNALDGILQGDYKCADGTDTRNYGGIFGIPEARALAAEYLETTAEQVMVGGNSSLQFMYQYVENAFLHGVRGKESAWKAEAEKTGGTIKFLCPAPGYDRHFAICETLGIEMIPVAMLENGPDMDAIESAIKADPLIKGIWCVPKYSNPGGVVYADEVVDRMAKLALSAGQHFRILWDNAYAEHHLTDNPPVLKNILAVAADAGTLDSVIVIGSTSKITHAGAGISFLASSRANLASFAEQLGFSTIGPDKVNQLRHVRFFGGMEGLRDLMQQHRSILQPKFDCVLQELETGLGGKEIEGRPIGTWTRPAGGYFIQFDTLPGLAEKVIALTAAAGVKLTPAGSTYPYRQDPHNSNIRLAPSFPSMKDLEQAIRVFVVCVEMATVEMALQAA